MKNRIVARACMVKRLGSQMPAFTGRSWSSNRVPGSTRARKPAMDTGLTTSAWTLTQRNDALYNQSFPFIPGSTRICKLLGT